MSDLEEYYIREIEAAKSCKEARAIINEAERNNDVGMKCFIKIVGIAQENGILHADY